MPFRVCKTFTVESGHMLSLHPEACRFPHGHTRTIEVVVEGDALDDRGMLLDFKALKMALERTVDRYDHSLAVNSNDPALPELQARYPREALVVFENQEPTTEAIAKDLYDYAVRVMEEGFQEGPYVIEPGRNRIVRVRVWETPSSWAEFAAG